MIQGVKMVHSFRKSVVASERNTYGVGPITCETNHFNWQTFPSSRLDLQFTISLFSFSMIFNTYNFCFGCLKVGGGKVSMRPQRLHLAGQFHCRLNRFCLSTSAVRALPPPPLRSPFLYCHKNSHFPLPQTWTFISSLSYSITHNTMCEYTYTHTVTWVNIHLWI